MMTAAEPTFLYPHSRQYPFDAVCEQIVHALDARSWSVPGITVEFDAYGSGDAKYRMLRVIKGDDFHLWFCRIQGNLGRWNDTAAVMEIIIPRKELRVYESESGPTLYVYAGNNWGRDRRRFLNGIKVNSKLDGERRWYLLYRGGWRSSRLVHDNDLGREYAPKVWEPKSYRTDEVFTEFTKWLTDNLLARILAVPPTDPADYLPPADFFRSRPNLWTPQLTAQLGPIFCFGDGHDAERVRQGKRDARRLDPSDRYGLDGGGYRLLPLGVPNDGTVPEVAYDGFLWCGFGKVGRTTRIETLRVPGHYRWPDQERFVFRLTPRWTDGIYVADHAPFEVRRTELFEAITPRARLTDRELGEAERARARTIMPILDYALLIASDPKRAYAQPVVMVNRELGLDEVELVSGPWYWRR